VALVRAEGEDAEAEDAPVPEKEWEEDLTEKQKEKKYQAKKAEDFCMSENCYEVMGVAAGTPAKEIKTIYKELAKQYHPDKLTGLPEDEKTEKEEKFKMIARAYRVLTKKKIRKQYDAYLYNPGSPEWYHMRRFYKHKAHAKFGILPVLIFLLGAISVAQYANSKFGLNSKLDSVLKDPNNRKAAKAKAEKAGLLKKVKAKDEIQAVLRSVIAEDFPVLRAEDTILYKLVMIPVNMVNKKSEEKKEE
jgi:curved DNA-binding protein CbpA